MLVLTLVSRETGTSCYFVVVFLSKMARYLGLHCGLTAHFHMQNQPVTDFSMSQVTLRYLLYLFSCVINSNYFFNALIYI